MSIFSDQTYTGLGQPKQCKRDIELEIKERRKEIEREEAFKSALYTYLQGSYYDGNKRFTIPELVGLLELSIRAMLISVENLLNELEMEKK